MPSTRSSSSSTGRRIEDLAPADEPRPAAATAGYLEGAEQGGFARCGWQGRGPGGCGVSLLQVHSLPRRCPAHYTQPSRCGIWGPPEDDAQPVRWLRGLRRTRGGSPPPAEERLHIHPAVGLKNIPSHNLLLLLLLRSAEHIARKEFHPRHLLRASSRH